MAGPGLQLWLVLGLPSQLRFAAQYLTETGDLQHFRILQKVIENGVTVRPR
jgi:hypothetical protein